MAAGRNMREAICQTNPNPNSHSLLDSRSSSLCSNPFCERPSSSTQRHAGERTGTSKVEAKTRHADPSPEDAAPSATASPLPDKAGRPPEGESARETKVAMSDPPAEPGGDRSGLAGAAPRNQVRPALQVGLVETKPSGSQASDDGSGGYAAGHCQARDRRR